MDDVVEGQLNLVNPVGGAGGGVVPPNRRAEFDLDGLIDDLEIVAAQGDRRRAGTVHTAIDERDVGSVQIGGSDRGERPMSTVRMKERVARPELIVRPV